MPNLRREIVIILNLLQWAWSTYENEAGTLKILNRGPVVLWYQM